MLFDVSKAAAGAAVFPLERQSALLLKPLPPLPVRLDAKGQMMNV